MTRARDVADTQDNIGGAVAPFVAGKNRIINGDFGIWQRGTSFTNPADNGFTVDRFRQNSNASGRTAIWSQQSFAPGNAIPGYEPTFFFRYAQTVAGTGATYTNFLIQPIEDARTFAGQTITLSFWAKADAARTVTPILGQEFGSGGSTSLYTTGNSVTLTTSWVRYSFPFFLPSVSGKTFGAGNTLSVILAAANNIVQTIDIWGLQLESGNVATPFTTATGNPASELAACQRYFVRYGANTIAVGNYFSSNNFYPTLWHKVTMRVAPSVAFGDISNYSIFSNGAGRTSTNAVGNNGNANMAELNFTTSSATPGDAGALLVPAGNFIDFSAEL